MLFAVGAGAEIIALPFGLDGIWAATQGVACSLARQPSLIPASSPLGSLESGLWPPVAGMAGLAGVAGGWESGVCLRMAAADELEGVAGAGVSAAAIGAEAWAVAGANAGAVAGAGAIPIAGD